MKATFFLILLTSLAAFGKGTELDSKKIDFLIKQVRESGGTFIRNGEKHPPKKAAEHLQMKYERAMNMFFFFGPKTQITATDFIEKIASSSSTSGEPYLIQLKGKEPIPTKGWLYEKLKEYK